MINTKALLTAAALSLGVVSGTHAADADHGKVVFDVWCTGCHEPLPGPSYATQIRTMVRNGRNMMPQTRKTEISDADLDDLIAYLTQHNKPKHGK